jgi:hypothetical protein
MALPVPLRNGLAELILDAFDDASARAVLRDLERAGGGAAALAGPAALAAAVGTAGPGRPDLLAAPGEHRAALADRARRGGRAVEASREAPRELLPRLLARAAALADERLFFEVHELLEPAWLEAAEPLRTALQGLIQIAVALHHLEHGNRAGARSLLGEGRRKLEVTAGALPLDAGGWLAGLGAAEDALDRGRDPGPVPPWPRPRQPAGPASRPPGGTRAGARREEGAWRSS